MVAEGGAQTWFRRCRRGLRRRIAGSNGGRRARLSSGTLGYLGLISPIDGFARIAKCRRIRQGSHSKFKRQESSEPISAVATNLQTARESALNDRRRTAIYCRDALAEPNLGFCFLNNGLVFSHIMHHIFISHAGSDSVVAEKLADDLKIAGHDVCVDLQELELGDDSIEFMNDAIADAHTVLILFSKDTTLAKWQRLEINAALWNEKAQAGGNCIVLRLDDTPLPPLWGPKVYGKLDVKDTDQYKILLEKICSKVMVPETATRTVSDAFKSESPNPFRRIRAEYFEEDARLLSSAFVAPEPTRTGALEEVTPCFLEGSRGTGKSMLLLSLRARVHISRTQNSHGSKRIFGFYLKLTRGAVCNVGVQPTRAIGSSDPEILKDFNPAQVTDIFCQEFVLCLIESLLSEFQHCLDQGLIQCDSGIQRQVAEQIFSLLFGELIAAPTSINGLLEYCAKMHRKIADFIRRRFIYGESPTLPIATCDMDALAGVIKLVKDLVPSLKDALFIALLDEYENLFPYQQRVVNTFVKFAPPLFTVKIAKKLGTSDVSATTTGQDLQEINDYSRLPLVYDVEDPAQKKAYRGLLERIVRNILKSEGYPDVPLSKLLPEFDDPEVKEADVEGEVRKLMRLSKDEFDALPDEKRVEKMGYYREAAIYRIVYGGKGRKSPKQFSGFTQLAFLSSGVIR